MTSEPYAALHERSDPREVARGEQLSLILWHLPAASLRKLAMFHATLSIMARERAATLEKRAKEQAAASAEVRAMALVDSPGVRRALRERARQERDVAIMRLARRGWTNKMIGKKLGCHEVTVSKAIARVLRPKTMGELRGRSIVT